jgi:hypothetical protein
MTPRIKKAYAYPERIVQLPDETGKLVWAREPGSPTREARSTDSSTWLEEVDDDDEYLATHAYA